MSNTSFYSKHQALDFNELFQPLLYVYALTITTCLQEIKLIQKTMLSNVNKVHLDNYFQGSTLCIVWGVKVKKHGFEACFLGCRVYFNPSTSDHLWFYYIKPKECSLQSRCIPFTYDSEAGKKRSSILNSE